MNHLSPGARFAAVNAAANARCVEDLDWADLGGIAREGGMILWHLGSEWYSRHEYRDRETQPPANEIIRLMCELRDLIARADQEAG